SRTNVDKIVQEFPPHTFSQGLWGSLAYWKGPTGEFIYGAGASDHLKAFKLTSGKLSTSPTSQSPETFSWPGGSPSVSTTGTTPGTGIFCQFPPGAILRPYDPTTLSHELYNSAQNSGRDGLGSYTKFTVPIVSNGQVFVGTKPSLPIFGMLSTGSPTPTA